MPVIVLHIFGRQEQGHETFVLLGSICAFAIVAGWRMQPPGAGVVRRDAPASEQQPTDIS